MNRLQVNFFFLYLVALPFIATAQKRVKIRAEKDMSAHLMVFFKDDTHGLYFALSSDGYDFTDANSGLPIIACDSITEQKGVRDPYIYRNLKKKHRVLPTIRV